MLAIAECSDGRTTPPCRAECPWCSGGEGRDGPGPGDDGGDGIEDAPEDGEDASELRERALLLRYTPCGTVIERRSGSASTVGMPGRSAYVKYAVRCHLRARPSGPVTKAEYACLTSPVGWWSLRS